MSEPTVRRRRAVGESNGAEERTRTSTPLRAQAPEALPSGVQTCADVDSIDDSCAHVDGHVRTFRTFSHSFRTREFGG
jgi:hypothetical protein